jgi:hypothetical protein
MTVELTHRYGTTSEVSDDSKKRAIGLVDFIGKVGGFISMM